MKSTELIELVDKLNNAAAKQTEGDTTIYPFAVTFDHSCQTISFFHHPVWWTMEHDHEDIKDELRSFLEAVARLDVPALVALLPEPEAEAEEVSVGEEELVAKCIEVIRVEQKASVSLFQRRLNLGDIRAARLCDILEARGIIGSGGYAAPREIRQLPEAEA